MKYQLKNEKIVVLLVVGTAFVVVLFNAKPATAQRSGAEAAWTAAEAKPTPRTADGHPDLNGLWNDSPIGVLNPDDREFEKSSDGSILFDFGVGDGGGGGGAACVDDSCQRTDQPSYKAQYVEKAKQIASTLYSGTSPLDPDMQCKPRGVPRGSIGGAMQIVQTPKLIAILYEGHPQPSSVYRIIYMDSPHPSDLDPTYMGDSRGHWEGDTLVVDVTGLNDQTWLGGAIEGGVPGVGVSGGKSKYTTIHSDKEHVVERWTRKGDAVLYEATVDDPVMLSKPWVVAPKRIHVDTTPGDQLLELFCTPEATGSDHFIKPSPEEQKRTCGSLGKAQYDACEQSLTKK